MILVFIFELLNPLVSVLAHAVKLVHIFFYFFTFTSLCLVSVSFINAVCWYFVQMFFFKEADALA